MNIAYAKIQNTSVTHYTKNGSLLQDNKVAVTSLSVNVSICQGYESPLESLGMYLQKPINQQTKLLVDIRLTKAIKKDWTKRSLFSCGSPLLRNRNMIKVNLSNP